MAYTIVWPADFPQVPLVNGYSRRPGERDLSTPMDKGPVKTRKRGKRSTFFTVSYLFHKSQIADLDEFCETTGVLRFGWPDPHNPAALLEVNIVRNADGDHYEFGEPQGQWRLILMTLEQKP